MSKVKITQKLNDQNAMYIFAEDIATNGCKRYIGSSSIFHLLDFVDSSPTKNFYEVAQGLED